MGEQQLPPVEQQEPVTPVSGEVVSTDVKRLVRSRRDRVIAGVCGGIGRYFGIDPVLVRALWVFFTLVTFGGAGVLYVVALFVMPESTGEEVNSVPRRSVQGNVFWGALLVLAGFYLLTRTILDRFVPSWIWNTIRTGAIAAVLVGAGLLLIVGVSRRGMGGGRRLIRSRKERIIGGVCGGLAGYLKVDPTWVRLIWIVLSLFATGSVFSSVIIGSVVYVVAMLAIPEEANDTVEG